MKLPLAIPTLAVCAMFAADAMAQRGDRGRRRGRRAEPAGTFEDLVSMRESLLAAEPPTGEMLTDFARLVRDEQQRRELPSFMEDPEAIYVEPHLSFRAECYGALMEDPEFLALLRDQVRSRDSDDWFSASTAAILLGDRPGLENLEALRDGYRGGTGSSWIRAGIVRNLGRACAASRESEEAGPLVQEIVQELLRTTEEGEPKEAGAAVEALYRAGEPELALEHLDGVLERLENPVESLELLRNCTRLFELPGVDPELKNRSIDMARAVAAEAVERADPQAPAMLRGLTEDARSYRAGIDFLRAVAVEEEFDFLLERYRDPRSAGLLGMDALQSLRSGLQGRRSRLSDEDRARLDDLFIDELYAVGERLFALAEEPLDAEEYREFLAGKNVRYNALSYLDSCWNRHADLRARLAADGEFAVYLAYLAGAGVEEREGDASDPLYYGVLEKTENRVLCAKLLARMQDDPRPEGVDLFAELFQILAAEVRAPGELKADALAFAELRSPWLSLEIPVNRTPSDRWLMNAAIDALKLLDLEVDRTDERVVLRFQEARAATGE